MDNEPDGSFRTNSDAEPATVVDPRAKDVDDPITLDLHPDNAPIVEQQFEGASNVPVVPPPSSTSKYSALPEGEKTALLMFAAFASIISPFSSGMFYPAVNELSRDLDKSVSLINLSISTYQVRSCPSDMYASKLTFIKIFQGLAPVCIKRLPVITGH